MKSTKKVVEIKPLQNETLSTKGFDYKDFERSFSNQPLIKQHQPLKTFFVDLNKLVSVSNIDGLHLSTEAHNKIGQFLIKYIEDNFKY